MIDGAFQVNAPKKRKRLSRTTDELMSSSVRPVPPPILVQRYAQRHAPSLPTPGDADQLRSGAGPTPTTPNSTTHLQLLQRAIAGEAEIVRLKQQIERLTHEIGEERRRRLEDPYYYVAPPSVLPPSLFHQHEKTFEMIGAYTALYRETSTLDRSNPLLHQEEDDDLQSRSMLRQLREENAFLRGQVAQLMAGRLRGAS